MVAFILQKKQKVVAMGHNKVCLWLVKIIYKSYGAARYIELGKSATRLLHECGTVGWGLSSL